jgi:hypothetical protein
MRRKLIMAVLGLTVMAASPSSYGVPPPKPNAPPAKTLSLKELLALPDDRLAEVDIATMNLACAEGLPGAEDIDHEAILQTLDAWSAGIGELTNKHADQFRKEPWVWDYSPGKFCAYELLAALQLYLGVHYNREQIANPNMKSSRDQFIHGPVLGTGGTCASLPVVYIAVGRRLGYPLRLAQAKSHYFVRWDDPNGEEFNIEGSGDGYAFYPDDHFREIPFKISDEELERGNYLQSMSPREELSTFLTTRADVLLGNDLIVEAYQMYRRAVEIAPRNLFAKELGEGVGRILEKYDNAERMEELIAAPPHRSSGDDSEHARHSDGDPRQVPPTRPATTNTAACIPSCLCHASSTQVWRSRLCPGSVAAANPRIALRPSRCDQPAQEIRHVGTGSDATSIWCSHVRRAVHDACVDRRTESKKRRTCPAVQARCSRRP